MPNYKIEANETLFDAWGKLSREVVDLASIVQNDVIVTGKQLREWEESAFDKLENFRELLNETNEAITSHLIANPDEPSIWIVLAFTDFIVMRIRIKEPLIKAEAEEVGRESCLAHGFQFHGVFSEDDIERAESELDIPF